MTKKILSILLAGLLLLSLAACAGEDITAKEKDTEPPAAKEETDGEDEEKEEDHSIPFSYGRLPIMTDEFSHLLGYGSSWAFEQEYGRSTILNYINVYTAKETCYRDLEPGFLELLKSDRQLTKAAQEMAECLERYDDAFFEKNQLLTVTLVSITSYGYTVHAEKITPVTDESGNTLYHVLLRLKHNQFGSDADVVAATTVSIELPKDLNISKENIVVEIADSN